ncbi:MAG: hypothetical protein PHX30_05685 [Candidatus Pacebacteria bacterium]|nr:hypothetical protein [Candidatus Paceibacterota bacterium]
MRRKSFLAILNILTLCIIIGFVSAFFVEDSSLIGFVLIALAFLCLASLLPFGVHWKSMQPDIFFGLIDNGILAILAIFGGHFAGVTGVIIGGVVGNAITDGLAGIFEGHWAEKLREKLIAEERSILSSSVGKMTGCLLGAGTVLIIASILKL